MISDVLSDAVVAMQEYLDHEGTKDCYQGDVRKRIEALMERMSAMRVELDTPPWMIVPGTLAGDVTQRQLEVADERTQRAFQRAQALTLNGELHAQSSMWDMPVDQFVEEFAREPKATGGAISPPISEWSQEDYDAFRASGQLD